MKDFILQFANALNFTSALFELQWEHWGSFHLVRKPLATNAQIIVEIDPLEMSNLAPFLALGKSGGVETAKCDFPLSSQSLSLDWSIHGHTNTATVVTLGRDKDGRMVLANYLELKRRLDDIKERNQAEPQPA